MDNANDKKWFIYVGDKHEGPFSVLEIKEKTVAKTYNTEQYVWCEGMADWLPMLDVPAFKVALKPEASVSGISIPSLSTIPSSQPQPIAESIGKSSPKVAVQPSLAKKTVPTQKSKPSADSGATISKRRMSIWGALLFIVAIIGLAMNFGLLDPGTSQKISEMLFTAAEPIAGFLGDKIPALNEWISPIQKMEGLSEQDFGTLKQAAKGKPEAGINLDVVGLGVDLPTPTLVIGSNLPDGTQLDVTVLGIPDTLVASTFVLIKKAALLNKKTAIVSKLTTTEGLPLPRGEYFVFLTESAMETQPDGVRSLLTSMPPVTAKMPEFIEGQKKIFFAKKLFLGGLRDQVYQERLKAYHDKMVEKANAEVAEIKQYTSSLISQFNLTNNQYNELKKQKNPKNKKKLWDPFHKKWEEFAAQMLQVFQNWSPAVLGKDYIHGKLYLLLQQSAMKVIRVHQLQNQATSQGKITPEADGAIASAVNEAQAELKTLQEKIEIIEKSPTTPGGVPQRLE